MHRKTPSPPSCPPIFDLRLQATQARFPHETLKPPSRIHPNHKTKYRVQNWSKYERGLVSRSDITSWLSPEAISTWSPTKGGRPGGQRKFSDLAIETALTARLVFGLPLRQAEGFLRSLFELVGLEIPVPDHTTLSRRSKGLNVRLRSSASSGPIHLIVGGSCYLQVTQLHLGNGRMHGATW